MIRQILWQLTFIFPVVVAVGCGGNANRSGAPATPTQQSTSVSPAEPVIPLGDVVVAMPAHIQFRPTADYTNMGQGTWFTNQKGYGQINLQITIGTVENQSSELSASLQAAGKKGIRSEDLPVTPSGLSRKLFSYEAVRKPSEQVDEWKLLIGKERWTTTVKVVAPAGITKELGPAIRAMLLSADAIPGDTRPVDSLQGFHLPESTLLKPAQLALWVDYTATGDMKSRKSAADPILNFNPVATSGKRGEEAADHHLNSMATISNIKVTSRQPIEVAGMSGFETEATAQLGKSETPVVIYQLVLFYPVGKLQFGDLTVRGTVGTEVPDKDKFLAEFRRMARGVIKE